MDIFRFTLKSLLLVNELSVRARRHVERVTGFSAKEQVANIGLVALEIHKPFKYDIGFIGLYSDVKKALTSKCILQVRLRNTGGEVL